MSDIADLAKKVWGVSSQDMDIDALVPLLDALEEAGDPRRAELSKLIGGCQPKYLDFTLSGADTHRQAKALTAEWFKRNFYALFWEDIAGIAAGVQWLKDTVQPRQKCLSHEDARRLMEAFQVASGKWEGGA